MQNTKTQNYTYNHLNQNSQVIKYLELFGSLNQREAFNLEAITQGKFSNINRLSARILDVKKQKLLGNKRIEKSNFGRFAVYKLISN